MLVVVLIVLGNVLMRPVSVYNEVFLSFAHIQFFIFWALRRPSAPLSTLVISKALYQGHIKVVSGSLWEIFIDFFGLIFFHLDPLLQIIQGSISKGRSICVIKPQFIKILGVSHLHGAISKRLVVKFGEFEVSDTHFTPLRRKRGFGIFRVFSKFSAPAAESCLVHPLVFESLFLFKSKVSFWVGLPCTVLGSVHSVQIRTLEFVNRLFLTRFLLPIFDQCTPGGELKVICKVHRACNCGLIGQDLFNCLLLRFCMDSWELDFFFSFKQFLNFCDLMIRFFDFFLHFPLSCTRGKFG